MSHQVLARKWRPHRFDEVVAQSHVVQALTNALTHNQLHHAYLFTGTRGVGKTTLARILTKCLNCEKGISATPCETCSSCLEIDSGRFVDLLEVDAASRTKVEDTRDLLDNVQYAPTKGRFKVYLIDEVHMLSGHSFNALLKTLEEPPAHVKFLLATTDPQRLPATILSRCLQFHLLPMPAEQIAQHLQKILKDENLPFEDEATLLLGKSADGSMRDALSLLDQAIAYGNNQVSTQSVKEMLGTIDHSLLFDLLNALKDNEANRLLELITQLSLLGTDFKQALAELLNLWHQIAVLQFVPKLEDKDPQLEVFAKHFKPEDVQLYYQIGLMGQRDLNLAPTPRVGFEMTLLRMLAFKPVAARSTSTHTPAPTKSPITTASPAAPKESPAPIQNKAPAAAPTTEWGRLLTHLELTGPTQALAQHCSLKSMNADLVELLLEPKQALMLNARHIQRISEALSKHLGKLIKVTIEPATASLGSTTPDGQAQEHKQAQLKAAEQAINSNPKVQKLMEAFDATIVKDSIVPNDS